MSSFEPIRILLVDDHQLFRSGISSLLDEVSDIVIVGEAKDGNEAIEKYFQLKPDIILLDIAMPEVNGIDAFKKIRQKDKEAKAIFLTMHDTEEYVYFAYKLGGMGLLSKNTLKGELIYAIKAAYNNDRYFGTNFDEDRLKELKRTYKGISSAILDDYLRLTVKEKKILECVSKGMMSQEIADKLSITKRTVDYYRSKLMQRLSIKSLPEFISYAVKFSMANKLLEDE